MEVHDKEEFSRVCSEQFHFVTDSNKILSFANIKNIIELNYETEEIKIIAEFDEPLKR